MKNQLFLAISLIALLFTACTAEKPADESADATTMADSTAAPAPAEFADSKYADIVKNAMMSFQNEDLTTWMANFSDNAVYAWNNGDSLAGKAAILDYWTKRYTDVVDSLQFTNQIFLPVKVNQPQSVEQPGVWVLTWHQTWAKYKTGKSMTQWMHSDYHFDANDKIDRVIHYMDRALILAATAK